MADEGIPAEVVEVVGRTGSRGEATQVLCRVIDGYEKGRIKKRNVKGNVKKGDILLLMNPETEAKVIFNAMYILRKRSSKRDWCFICKERWNYFYILFKQM